jgi:hypothetical protein
MLYIWWFWVEIWSKKGLIHYYAYTNVANRIVFSFLWRRFSSVGIGEWWDELKNGQKLKLGDAHVTPRNIQEVHASKLGNAPEAPLLHRQKLGHLSTHYIFIASCIMCFSWSVLSLVFSFVCFNKWLDPNKFLLEKLPCFSFAKNTPFFTLIIQRVFFFF